VYVGKTINPLPQREKQHSRNFKENLKIHLLDVVNKNDWKFWEIYWISQFKTWGFTLYNANNGGGGLDSHTDQTKMKMRNLPHPGTSEKLKGRERPDTRERMLGKTLSPTTRDRISKAKSNHECYQSQERTDKIIESNQYHYSPGSERNKKISEKLKGREIKNPKPSRPILQYSKENVFIREWPSISEIASQPGYKGIGNNLAGRTKSSAGFVWKYKYPNI
jgi:hypothetical protein